MNFFQAIILGVIEGITEFLPVSSTGHLMVGSEILAIPKTEFLKSFEIAIQLGAIASVVFLYWKKFLFDKDTLLKTLFAFIPTGVLGAIFYQIIKKFLLEDVTLVAWMLLLGGIGIIAFEYYYKRKKSPAGGDMITYPKAFLIGIFQAFAFVPGVSRAAATIIGGLMIGINRQRIVEFSFLLAVPTMFAATVFDVYQNIQAFSANDGLLLLVGFTVSSITAVLSIKFLLRFIQKNTFISFGVYRIILAVLIMLFLL